MASLLGQTLLEEKIITPVQLQKALARQKSYGQRLGHNLISLGFISPEDLSEVLKRKPAPPKSITETDLDPIFLVDLALKHVLFLREFNLQELATRLKLPVPLLEPTIDTLRQERYVQVRGASEFVKSSYRFAVTEAGKAAAMESLKLCRYVGPAPVTLNHYRKMVLLQTVKNIIVDDEVVREAFANLTLNEDFLNRLGPAICSGHAIFIYGPPGNGKTSIAETIGEVLPGTVFVPYAILVEGQIIMIYDAVNHKRIFSAAEQTNPDQRWVEIERPVLIAGGELTLDMLDLQFNTISKTYQAPLQMKANNGLFIVDDLGRQRMRPEELFNRWIVNLERHVDFLSLHTGVKFDVPFDQLIIFSTNHDPKTLVDDAFLRRIRYKFRVDYPTISEYKNIFQKVCIDRGLEFKEEVFDYLMIDHYIKCNKKPSACHARDLIEHIVDECRYHNRLPELSLESIDNAWKCYFL